MKGSRTDHEGSPGSEPEKADRLRGTPGRRREPVDARQAVDPSWYEGQREAHLRGTPPQKVDIQPPQHMRNEPVSTTRVDDGAEILRSRTAQPGLNEIFNTPKFADRRRYPIGTSMMQLGNPSSRLQIRGPRSTLQAIHLLAAQAIS